MRVSRNMYRIRNTIVILITIVLSSCNFEHPTQFSEAALNDTFITLGGDTIPFKTILETYTGKKILVDVWASWCGDCIKGIPDEKALQAEFPEVVYLFLSEDRSFERWKKSIKKYNIEGEHYFMANGSKSVFKDFLNSNWIPRYLVIDKKSGIKLFKAKKATDKRIKEALN